MVSYEEEAALFRRYIEIHISNEIELRVCSRNHEYLTAICIFVFQEKVFT